MNYPAQKFSRRCPFPSLFHFIPMTDPTSAMLFDTDLDMARHVSATQTGWTNVFVTCQFLARETGPSSDAKKMLEQFFGADAVADVLSTKVPSPPTTWKEWLKTERMGALLGTTRPLAVEKALAAVVLDGVTPLLAAHEGMTPAPNCFAGGLGADDMLAMAIEAAKHTLPSTIVVSPTFVRVFHRPGILFVAAYFGSFKCFTADLWKSLFDVDADAASLFPSVRAFADRLNVVQPLRHMCRTPTGLVMNERCDVSELPMYAQRALATVVLCGGGPTPDIGTSHGDVVAALNAMHGSSGVTITCSRLPDLVAVGGNPRATSCMRSVVLPRVPSAEIGKGWFRAEWPTMYMDNIPAPSAKSCDEALLAYGRYACALVSLLLYARPAAEVCVMGRIVYGRAVQYYATASNQDGNEFKTTHVSPMLDVAEGPAQAMAAAFERACIAVAKQNEQGLGELTWLLMPRDGVAHHLDLVPCWWPQHSGRVLLNVMATEAREAGYTPYRLLSVSGTAVVLECLSLVAPRERVAVKLVAARATAMVDAMRAVARAPTLPPGCAVADVREVFRGWLGTYVVMQFVKGASPPLTLDVAVDVLPHVRELVTVMHAHGVVHGNIVLDNIVHDQAARRVTLLGFGNARPADAAGVACDIEAMRVLEEHAARTRFQSDP